MAKSKDRRKQPAKPAVTVRPAVKPAARPAVARAPRATVATTTLVVTHRPAVVNRRAQEKARMLDSFGMIRERERSEPARRVKPTPAPTPTPSTKVHVVRQSALTVEAPKRMSEANSAAEPRVKESRAVKPDDVRKTCKKRPEDNRPRRGGGGGGRKFIPWCG